MSRYKGARLVASGGVNATSLRGENLPNTPGLGTANQTLQYTGTDSGSPGQLVWATVSTEEVVNNIFATFEEVTFDVEYVNTFRNRSYVMVIELDIENTVIDNAERYQLKLYSQDLDSGGPGNRTSTTLSGAALTTAATTNQASFTDQTFVPADTPANDIESLTVARTRAQQYFNERESIIQ